MTVPVGDWGSSNRRDEYTFALVDPFTLADTGEYVRAPYGKSSVTLGYYTDNYYSASIETNEKVPPNRLIRVLHSAILEDGTRADEILGTYFVKDTNKTAEAGNLQYSYSCQSTWLRFSGDKATQGMCLEAGYVANFLLFQDIIEARGGRTRRLDDLTEASKNQLVLGSSCTHEIDDTVSSVINDIAASCNRKITVDDEGYVLVTDIPDHTTQEEVYTFIEGPACTFKRKVTESDSNTDKCNRVVGTVSYEQSIEVEDGDDITQVFTKQAEATLDPSDPFSFETIGRFVTRNEDYGTADTLADYTATLTTLKSKVEAVLRDNSGSIIYYEIEHVGIPGLRQGDIVRYINYTDDEEPIDARCLITQMQITLGAGAWTKTKLKVIG